MLIKVNNSDLKNSRNNFVENRQVTNSLFVAYPQKINNYKVMRKNKLDTVNYTYPLLHTTCFFY